MLEIACVQLFHLLYFSQKSPGHTGFMPQDASAFQANNRKLGITGILVECDGSYLQVLEGRRTEISALLAKIFRDARHSSVTIARAEQIDERFF